MKVAYEKGVRSAVGKNMRMEVAELSHVRKDITTAYGTLNLPKAIQ